LAFPADVVCPHCRSANPQFRFEPVSGQGSIRSWAVVHDSFLPGFEADLPFVLVDVELDEQHDDIMEGGRTTAARLWEHSGLSREDVDLPQLYDGFSPFIYFWLESLGFCPLGEAHRFVADGGINADKDGLPVLTGGGAIGNGRMHGVPQMLECYLQLSGRAGDRQRSASVGLACHSSPHLGGAVLYTKDPL
jgi:acetyl-CoA acetyltransferase